ncbi:putative reverse transcriptase domain-containing protein [Tanacetum coccineum]
MQRTPLHQGLPTKRRRNALEEAYYTQFGGPFQGGGYRATAPGYYQMNNANPSFQERRQSMEDTMRKFMSESAKRHEENSNLIKETRAFDRCCAKGNQRAIYQNFRNTNGKYEHGLGEFAHTRLTVESTDRTVKYPKGIAENVLVGIGKFTFPIDFIILDMPEDVKVPLILGRPFLSTAHAKIDVYKIKITLRLDLEARLIGETLVLNRSLDPFSKDYIELNDLNKPFKLRRNQGDDLMPTIEEGEVIEEFRTRDEDLDTGIDDYPSYCDDDKKIHIDFLEDMDAYRDNEMCAIIFGDATAAIQLWGVHMYMMIPKDCHHPGGRNAYIGAYFIYLDNCDAFLKKFHNSIMKNKMVYKGNNVVGALMNVPIFVGTFSVMTDFAVLEDMDAYRDNEMGDIIFGEPFLREVGIKTKWFEGIITLTMVSEKDKINGISHAYQKLKGFYKEVLNLGPDFIRVPSMEEWLTRGHISVHELE